MTTMKLPKESLTDLTIRIRNHGHWILSSNLPKTVPSARITSAEWKRVLLASEDNLVFNGSIYIIIGKSIGFGVVELSFEKKYN